MTALTFTVFTPTYNRAGTLHRPFRSLMHQTVRDFEWLIVDDGSTDGTDRLVERWKQEADFPIRYVFQENAGKHVASNRGAQLAEGELFLTLDSDDECDPDALERFLSLWDEIPEERREEFAGVTVLCRDQHGDLVGSRFPSSPLDSDAIELVFRHRVWGEKWGFQRTDVMRSCPFPEPPGAKNLAMGIAWRAIALKYRTRFVNEVLRTWWREDDPASPRLTSLSPKVLPGRILYHAQTLDDLMPWFRHAPAEFFSAAINLTRYASLRGDRPGQIMGEVRTPLAKTLVAAMMPVGYLTAWRDRHRMSA